MPNALPRIAEPDEHRIQISDVFSTSHGRHNFKFGGDFNIVHEVMINLFQGGGIYSYGEANNVLNFQDWILDAFAGQSGDTDPYAGYHYSTLVQTVDQVNTSAGTQGKDDFWMKMYDGFAEDTWKVNSQAYVDRRRSLRRATHAEARTGQQPFQSDLVGVHAVRIKNVPDRVQPRVAFSWSPFARHRGSRRLRIVLRAQPGQHVLRDARGEWRGAVELHLPGMLLAQGLADSWANATCPTLRWQTIVIAISESSCSCRRARRLSTAQYPAGGTPPG